MALPTFAAGRKLRASELAALLLMQAKTYEGVASSTQPIAAALTDVAGATVTFTTATANAVAVCVWSIDFNITVAAAGVIAFAQLDIDGAPSPLSRQLVRNIDAVARDTGTQRYRAVLPVAGSHTIKVRSQKTGAGGTVTSGQDHSGLTVVVYENP